MPTEFIFCLLALVIALVTYLIYLYYYYHNYPQYQLPEIGFFNVVQELYAQFEDMVDYLFLSLDTIYFYASDIYESFQTEYKYAAENSQAFDIIISEVSANADDLETNKVNLQANNDTALELDKKFSKASKNSEDLYSKTDYSLFAFNNSVADKFSTLDKNVNEFKDTNNTISQLLDQFKQLDAYLDFVGGP
jgi:hypothetical protein